MHTTEFNASSDQNTLTSGPTVLFRKKDLELLGEELRNIGLSIETTFNLGDQNFDQFHDISPYSDYSHLKLKLNEFITTSIGLTVRKIQ